MILRGLLLLMLATSGCELTIRFGMLGGQKQSPPKNDPYRNFRADEVDWLYSDDEVEKVKPALKPKSKTPSKHWRPEDYPKRKPEPYMHEDWMHGIS